jgi:uncharacterized protein
MYNRSNKMPVNQLPERRDAEVGREVKSYSFSIKAAGEDGSIEGYGSVFGVKDSYDDVIAPGAFTKSLQEHKKAGTNPAMLWQHDTEEPIGIWTEVSEDKNGLRVRGQLSLETVRGKEAHALVKMGALNGLSIGFISKMWEYDKEKEIRTLTEIELWEVSVVTFPANGKARVTSVKGADVAQISTIRQAEKTLRDAGFSDDAAKVLVAKVKQIAIDERDARNAAVATQNAASRLLKTLTT